MCVYIWTLLSGTTRYSWVILFLALVQESAISARIPGFFYWRIVLETKNQALGMLTVTVMLFYTWGAGGQLSLMQTFLRWQSCDMVEEVLNLKLLFVSVLWIQASRFTSEPASPLIWVCWYLVHLIYRVLTKIWKVHIIWKCFMNCKFIQRFVYFHHPNTLHVWCLLVS